MGTHTEKGYIRGESCKGEPGTTKYLLLVWQGWWNQEGPEHGRCCLFDSPEDIHRWVAREFRNRDNKVPPDLSYDIVPVEMPPAPLP
jgi:hypothetical protein